MIIVRKATTADIPSIAPLFDAYRVWYHQVSDITTATAFLTERLQQQQSVIFIAFDADKAVGFTQLYPIFSSVSMRTAWLLNDLYVDASVRKQGVGRKLLDAAQAFGKEQNSKWLMLQTSFDNYNAQRLYESYGWKKETDLFYTLSLE